MLPPEWDLRNLIVSHRSSSHYGSAYVSSVERACARRGRFLSLLLPVDQRAGGGGGVVIGGNRDP